MKAEKRDHEYLSYVSLGEAWKEIKVTFIVWVIFSAGTFVLALLFMGGAEASKPLWEWMPRPVLYFLCVVALTWFFVCFRQLCLM